MIAPDLFVQLPPEEVEEIFGWLYEHDRNAYRTCVGMLAIRRKLRPVFIERKPRDERHVWMKDALSRVANKDLATEILQSWILGANEKMVCEFLDILGIPHNGSGLVETLPPEAPPDRVAEAVNGVISKYSQTAVIVYFNLLLSMEIADWPELTKIVSSDTRLCLKPLLPTR